MWNDDDDDEEEEDDDDDDGDDHIKTLWFQTESPQIGSYFDDPLSCCTMQLVSGPGCFPSWNQRHFVASLGWSITFLQILAEVFLEDRCSQSVFVTVLVGEGFVL